MPVSLRSHYYTSKKNTVGNEQSQKLHKNVLQGHTLTHLSVKRVTLKRGGRGDCVEPPLPHIRSLHGSQKNLSLRCVGAVWLWARTQIHTHTHLPICEPTKYQSPSNERLRDQHMRRSFTGLHAAKNPPDRLDK